MTLRFPLDSARLQVSLQVNIDKVLQASLIFRNRFNIVDLDVAEYSIVMKNHNFFQLFKN